MSQIDYIVDLANYYREQLVKIRDEEVPFTRSWRLANDALQNPPKPTYADRTADIQHAINEASITGGTVCLNLDGTLTVEPAQLEMRFKDGEA